ncbi:aspartate/glutamate racemase family protein [Marinobacter psychrophilus]|jgi:allantoin racemase|uniref:aspartate/glutamate racemase family protein n=1 Tax=Marinobacter psychrophilus TaxID=330734 RepID=UPI001B61BE11|nr:aspartate/glutamate racemase family protein [Marinobacter psychrophilus]MBQ0764679.1 aspartate/glutamate racemase family protein [Marinobacter psychrophilus]MBQ0843347.1 aspartate/glutamate racemase family protein [Marinobacter psychrophilus]
MIIKVINPNTTQSMTDKIGATARLVAAAGTEIIAVSPRFGPVSIEGHYDEALSVVGVLDEIRSGEAAGVDAYVIACFGDPGLLAARELASGPVIGIAEAAMHAASVLTTGFSVVTTLVRSCIIAEHLTHNYGMAKFCRGIHGTDLAVLDLEESGSDAYQVVLNSCRQALATDRSGAIVMGCAGMSDLCVRLQDELEVPVIDGVTAAIKWAEGMVAIGLKTSKKGDLALPIGKLFSGDLARFGK